MLILTRKVSERITIGPDITVTVLGINGGQVRIGIAAPKHVAVHREEVAERIAAQHRVASKFAISDLAKAAFNGNLKS